MHFKLFTRLIGGLGFSMLFVLAAFAPPALAQSPDDDASPDKTKTAVSELSVSPTTLTYTVNLDTATSETEHFTIKDQGSAALDVTVNPPSGTDAADYVITSGGGSNTIPGKAKGSQNSLTVDVEFTPDGTAKNVDATIDITSDATKGKKLATVHLHGKAEQKKPTPTPTATPPFSVTGTAIQNGMNGAAISAVSVNSNGSDGASLGSATADSNGNFSMSITPPSNAPVRFRAGGGSYLSEQDGATINSPSPLSVLLPNVRSNLAALSINPLTTFVDSQARGNMSRGQNLATALSNSTTSIERDFGISTDPSTLIPLYTPAAAGTDAGRLGLIVGAMVNEDQLACASAPGGLVGALSSDISDGVFDGMNSGTPVSYCGGDLAAIAGTAQFGDALSGLQGLVIATSGFTFGGTNNALSLNGVTAADAAGDAATIEDALVAAAPPSVNTFAATTPSMNIARSSDTATLLPNGLVLVAGGYDDSPDGGFLSSTDLYDPATNSFAAPASTPSMNPARVYPTATLLPNGEVLIAGGAGNLSSTDLYDPATNTFAASTSTPVMNTGRASATAILLPNGKVLIVGGEMQESGGGFLFLSSIELYDTVSNTFAASPPSMKTARVGPTATLLPNGLVLIAGGAGNAGALSSTELYNPATNTFAPSASTPVMNNTRYGGTATLLPNGKVLIAGGEGPGGGNNLSSTDLYDPATNTFAPSTSTPVMNTGRYQDTATLLPNGKVLIAGGTGNTGTLSSTELYDPLTNAFAASASTPVMNTARSVATATLLPNGKVLIAGGFDGNLGADVTLSSTDLYTP